MTRVAQLAFLAPDVIDAIAKGRQPMALTAKRLIEMVPLPMDWAQQRIAFNAMT